MALGASNPLRRLLALSCLVGLTAVAYLGSLHGEFVVDDRSLLLANPRLTAPENPFDFFSRSSLDFVTPDHSNQALFRPLWLLSFWAGHALWGENPLGYHLLSLVVHLASSVLIFFLLAFYRSRGDTLAPLCGALAFSLHPVHVEAVAWISSVGHLLVTFLLLAGFGFYVRHRRRASLRDLTLCLACFALALLTQENAVIFPAVLMAFDWIEGRRITTREIAAVAIATVVYLLVRGLLLGSAVPVVWDTGSAWLLLPRFAAHYVWLLLLPWPQPIFLYGGAADSLGPSPLPLLLAVLVGVAVLAMRRTARLRPVLMGAAWLGLALLPALSAVFFPTPVFALRFLYLPSVGVSFLVAWGVDGALRDRRAPTLGLAAVFCAAAVWGIVLASRTWSDEGRVFSSMREWAPENPDVRFALATYYSRIGDTDRALEAYAETARLARGHLLAKALSEIGGIRGRRGDLERSHDDYSRALEADETLSSAWVGLGNIAFMRRQPREAIALYQRAYAADPTNWQACFNMARAYEVLGDLSKAQAQRALAGRIRGRGPSAPPPLSEPRSPGREAG